MRLDGDARLLEGPGRAELAGDGLHVVAAAGRAEEAAWRFQDLVGGGPAVSCELRGDHAALRGAAGVERLRHGAEVLAQSRRLAAGDGERALQRFAIEAHEATGGGSGSEGDAGRGRLEAGRGMARIDRFGELSG